MLLVSSTHKGSKAQYSSVEQGINFFEGSMRRFQVLELLLQKGFFGPTEKILSIFFPWPF